MPLTCIAARIGKTGVSVPCLPPALLFTMFNAALFSTLPQACAIAFDSFIVNVATLNYATVKLGPAWVPQKPRAHAFSTHINATKLLFLLHLALKTLWICELFIAMWSALSGGRPPLRCSKPRSLIPPPWHLEAQILVVNQGKYGNIGRALQSTGLLTSHSPLLPINHLLLIPRLPHSWLDVVRPHIVF
ncbi:hypothetical protein FA95DRAFT_850179 [Auriscalpium vulgare]|uniref:Uncharacterized protein n=1 Tax=Auriscalpium vulgare TaxID=40419 RepID=A0ACB8RAP8_9AGAM|nr:hypothetical protein FA95DRAFT_850179 [Auriscalpium vulgare]